MINIVSEKNILNGNIIDRNFTIKLIEADSTGIYEVIRVINKKPVFLNEHFERLINSIKLSDIDVFFSYDMFKDYVEKLIAANEFENCNIRVSFDAKDKPLLFMYYVKSFYPDESYYKNGIHTITIMRNRKNPNVKMAAKNYREEIDLLLYTNNAFEAILVNYDNTISEGSKSNVFFVKDNALITARDEDVLLGVTRSKVIEIAADLGVRLERRIINKDEIKCFDAAFITGTSNNVLPINSIDDIVFDSCSNNVVNVIKDKYEGLISS